MDRIIDVCCDGGIGNRINSLILGYMCAYQQNYKLRIVWPTNRWCMASFDDVFEKKNHVVNKISFKEFKESCRNNGVLFSHENQLELDNSKFYHLYSFHSLNHFRKAVASAFDKSLQPIIYSSQLPGFLPLWSAEAFLEDFPFSANLISASREFLSSHDLHRGDFWGVHIRGTDTGKTLSDFKYWLNMIDKKKKSYFFVCSDEPVIERTISNLYDNVILRHKNSHVTKADKGESWCKETFDEDGRLFSYNILRPKEAVIEGCIDLIILSKSQPLITSRSTFLTLAIMLSNHTKTRVRLIIHLLLMQLRWFVKATHYKLLSLF